MQKSMIFHYPFTTQAENAGSQVWVLRMIEAFKELGYAVEVVMGYADERKKAIERIKAEVAKGRQFDFLFSEAATRPTLLAKQNIGHPLMDFAFFQWCKSHSIPRGLFYIDVHWRFDHFQKNVAWYKRAIAWPLYWYDWLAYRQLLDQLYLPSLKMKTALPTDWPDQKLTALPPGCVISDQLEPAQAKADDRLQLFYVGGIAPPLYDLKPMVEAVKHLDQVVLTLCCRATEWAKFQSYYNVAGHANIQIVHAHGEGLKAYYANADLFSLLWEPYPYLAITMPVKIMETLGYGLPLVTTAATEAANFVGQEGIGWVVANGDEFRALLIQLQANPQLITEKRRRAEAIRGQHTWRARAQTVVDTLCANRP